MLSRIGIRKGICAVLGVPHGYKADFVVKASEGNELLIYFQSPDTNIVRIVQESAEKAKLLNKRIFVSCDGLSSVHLADNVADAVWVSTGTKVNESELLRILRPGGAGYSHRLLGWKKTVKEFPEDIDSWSHPYHGPDNNPQSNDKVIQYPYLTQFLGYPLFGCISEVTVASRGMLFKAFGHIAFKTAHNEVLNKLYGINGYNGTILWTRPLKKGFMIHRNTMIATPDILYLADDESCKLIDSKTGEIHGNIVAPDGLTEGRVWKWMGMENGNIYALVGGEEVKTQLQPGTKPGFGHWPWAMWPGYDYKGGEKAFGFGRDFMAVNPRNNKILWHYREKDLVDSRGVCMKDKRIYYYCTGKSVTCLDASNGKVVWRTTDETLMTAIGPDGPAQLFLTGFSTSTYIKCDGKRLFFAGPQRPNLVALSCADGRMLWSSKNGNYQLVLRDDALYAVGGQSAAERKTSRKFEYETGRVISEFSGRRGCTRATGTRDSIFYRADEGTIRYVPSSGAVEHIAPMRPPCQDGVIASDGMLYWGPWICGCPLSLYGNIAVGPAGNFEFQKEAVESDRLEVGKDVSSKIKKLEGELKTEGRSTTCGNMIFSTHENGVIQALENGRTEPVWKIYTGAGINFAPAVWQGRVYVGANDGWVYTLEALTGRLLWKFRAAPREERIPVYGKLMSRWPVAGGVVVQDGILYAAAGIAHYDGTHVYALDAVTGHIKWQNNSSGSIGVDKSGTSLQGQLSIKNGKLTFPGGNAYSIADFDLQTGKLLSDKPGNMSASTFYEVNSYLQKLERLPQPDQNNPATDMLP